MKKLVAFVLMLVLLVTISGCTGKTYELPDDQFCYLADGSHAIELSEADKQYIIDTLNNATWDNDATNCGHDYMFYTQKQKIRYHSECGTFIDLTRKKWATLTDEQRTTINNILGIE